MHDDPNYLKLPRGFTLLELLLVITLIGALVLVSITRIAESSVSAKEKTCYHHRAQISSALERYIATTGNLPTALSDVDTDDYFPGGIPTCPVTGSTYSLNTTTHRIESHTNSGNH